MDDLYKAVRMGILRETLGYPEGVEFTAEDLEQLLHQFKCSVEIYPVQDIDWTKSTYMVVIATPKKILASSTNPDKELALIDATIRLIQSNYFVDDLKPMIGTNNGQNNK